MNFELTEQTVSELSRSLVQIIIAQQRERAVTQLVQRISADPTETEVAAARKIMNRFYRLCGADERLLYLENDERTHNRPSTIELANKRDKMLNALKQDFKAYNISLVYYGYLPTICDSTSNQDLYVRFFYQ